jgi:CheY-like chemotaxis protein
MKGPIIIIDDDREDLQLFEMAFKEIGVANEMIYFEQSAEALKFLKTTDKQPYFILCDVNMPEINGLELRDEINKDERLKLKSIPFLFVSTSSDKRSVNHAYGSSAQGYFRKPSSFNDIKIMFQSIIHYWDHCLHPNSAQFISN